MIVKYLKCLTDEECYEMRSSVMNICIEYSECFGPFLLSKNRDFTRYIFQRHRNDVVKTMFYDPERVLNVLDIDYPRGIIKEMGRQFGFSFVVVLDCDSNYHLFFTNDLSIIMDVLRSRGRVVIW